MRVWSVGVAAVFAPALLPAQSTVAGTVRDSLTGAALGGAVVSLVPAADAAAAPRTAAADAAGHFRILAVPPGHYLLGFAHPRLDSLDVDAPVRRVDVPATGGDVAADLALPAAADLGAAVCGSLDVDAADGAGVFFGRVRDAEQGTPVAGAAVLVRWPEERIDARGAHHVVAQVRVVADGDGRFAACGVPTDAALTVRAADGGRDSARATGDVVLAFPTRVPILHRDLYIGPGVSRGEAARHGTAAVAGRVRRPDGTPLGGAWVVVHGAHAADSATVTGADGTFRLEALPGGTFSVEARTIGLLPARGVVDLRPGHTAPVHLALGDRVPTLDPVAVREAGNRNADEFAAHVRDGGRRGGVYFLTAARVDQRAPRFVTDALATVPALMHGRITVDGDGRQRLVLMGRASCAPAVYLDGTRLRDGLKDLDDLVVPSDVRGVEV